jgi:hypothetical protein
MEEQTSAIRAFTALLSGLLGGRKRKQLDREYAVIATTKAASTSTIAGGFMQLQQVTAKPYALLPSGVLIVEPHPGLLAARSLFLAAADCYLAVSSESKPALPVPDLEVSVAILSQSLGNSALASIAQGVRARWPIARIMIFGNAGLDIEDHLYDAAVDEHCRPEALLDALLQLSNVARSRSGSIYKLLDGDGNMPPEISEPLPQRIPAESDPSHLPLRNPLERERPGDESPRRRDL